MEDGEPQNEELTLLATGIDTSLSLALIMDTALLSSEGFSLTAGEVGESLTTLVEEIMLEEAEESLFCNCGFNATLSVNLVFEGLADKSSFDFDFEGDSEGVVTIGTDFFRFARSLVEVEDGASGGDR